jgi:transposase InsO family protein
MANYADSTSTPRTLTEREQRLLLKITGEHRAACRDHCLYAMALGTSLREHELIALSVGDVFRDGRPRRRLLLSVFKGAQRTGNAKTSPQFVTSKAGPRCHPVSRYVHTISDGYSRYLLRCDGLLHPGGHETKEVFEAAFREFGLPQVMRTDNGTPFSGSHGSSKLSVWWIKLGITPERIARGKPTQNGRHERIHKTLKQDVLAHKTRRSLWSQQREFDRFRFEYNEERPHEALGQKPPASLYETSPRQYPTKLREPEYGAGFETQRASADGSIMMAKKRFRISSVLAHEPVGLKELDDGTTEIYYGPLLLAWISEAGRFHRGVKRPTNKPIETETNTHETLT